MTVQPPVTQCLEEAGLEEKIRTFRANKSLSNYHTVGKDTDMSVFKGLSLQEWLEVKQHICITEHPQPCSGCSSLIKIAHVIIREGYIRLNEAFSVSNPGHIKYQSTHAKRKFLQLLLAAIIIPDEKCGGVVVYLVDKTANMATIRSFEVASFQAM